MLEIPFVLIFRKNRCIYRSNCDFIAPPLVHKTRRLRHSRRPPINLYTAFWRRVCRGFFDGGPDWGEEVVGEVRSAEVRDGFGDGGEYVEFVGESVDIGVVHGVASQRVVWKVSVGNTKKVCSVL